MKYDVRDINYALEPYLLFSNQHLELGANPSHYDLYALNQTFELNKMYSYPQDQIMKVLRDINVDTASMQTTGHQAEYSVDILLLGMLKGESEREQARCQQHVKQP